MFEATIVHCKAKLGRRQPGGNYKELQTVSNLADISKRIDKMAVEHERMDMWTIIALMNHVNLHIARIGHDTNIALLKITNHLRCAMDQDQWTLLVVQDHSVAFDNFNHKIVFNRMGAGKM